MRGWIYDLAMSHTPELDVYCFSMMDRSGFYRWRFLGRGSLLCMMIGLTVFMVDRLGVAWSPNMTR